MKKLSIFSALLCLSSLCFAQDTTGLIAHWNMNGSASDVTGNGHNGTASNVTPAAGEDGVMGHAYSFNGTNSMITVPYAPSFNVSSFSICATVKVEGYYLGLCQTSSIFTRGNTGPSGVGNYYLCFNDKPNDGLDCYDYDTTKDVFFSGAFSALPPSAGYGYLPTIVEGQWYSIVSTFNDTTFNVYVDGVLKSSNIIPSPGTDITTSNDSISIGFNVFNSTFPYPFNGIIDDIRLYNRVLTTAEIDSYTTTTGTLAVNTIKKPENEISIYPNPATNELNIAATAPLQGEMIIVITDLLGREVIKTQGVSATTKMDVAGLNHGVYIASIFLNNQVTIRKFVKE